MITAKRFLDVLEHEAGGFMTGVPDSQLKELCAEVYQRYGVNNKRHIVAVNEGNAIGLAAGYHLATGKVPVVYLQNSGLGNTVNPLTSLSDPAVFGIPLILVVGWRGEPDLHDEPEHVKMGGVTPQLLDLLGIAFMILDKETTTDDVERFFSVDYPSLRKEGHSFAFLVKKGAFSKTDGSFPRHQEAMEREYAICRITDDLGPDDFVVASTGKISRELYEHVRNERPGFSCHDFLMIGSMGHASSIALSVALRKPGKTIWCFDGDGALLMHMGALATVGALQPRNFVHVLFDNESHESVGGMPTISGNVDLNGIAHACGYKTTYLVRTAQELESLLPSLRKSEKPAFVHVLVSSGSRNDLIRPDKTPYEIKDAFMEAVSS